jgi:hypothetical protein
VVGPFLFYPCNVGLHQFNLFHKIVFLLPRLLPLLILFLCETLHFLCLAYLLQLRDKRTRMSKIQDGTVALSVAECDLLDEWHRQYKQMVAAAWSLVGDPTKSPGSAD